MIFDVRLIAVTIMCLYIQIVQSENVTIDIATAKPYMCGDTLQLKCTYTGPRSCCSDFNRKWTVDEKDLMTNGNLEPFAVGKYEEGEVGGDFFILLIKNLEKADMSEKKYTCQYAFEDMNPTTLDGSCVCVDCCWQCILFALLGLVVGFIIELSVNYKLLSAKDHVRKAIVVGIEGLVISLAAAGSIGYFLCPCLSSIGPIFIPVGFVFGSTLLLVLLYQYKFGDKDAEGLCQLISLGVLTIGIWIVVKKCTNGGNTESAKSGSSCWPPCRVDQDPETRSHAPVNVGRSSERPTPNKEKGKKPVARVSSQPQTAHHVKTENTASAVSSTEKEPFKPRPLPNIVMNTETPRPLPMMPPGTQQEKASNKLDPIDPTAEKKKKKKRRKKETDQTKQTDVENSTEL